MKTKKKIIFSFFNIIFLLLCELGIRVHDQTELPVKNINKTMLKSIKIEAETIKDGVQNGRQTSQIQIFLFVLYLLFIADVFCIFYY